MPLFTSAMDKLIVAEKFYKDDFKSFRVVYSNKLILSPDIDRSKILEAAPGYETPANCARFAKAVQNGYEAPIYLKFINDVIGYGAFADACIEEGDIIAEYTGNVISFAAAAQIPLKKRTYFMQLPNCYAATIWPQPLFVDARKVGNCTRFINHSYEPNLQGKAYFDGAMWHVIFVAARRLERDQQLLIDYGKDYWDVHGQEPKNLN